MASDPSPQAGSMAGQHLLALRAIPLFVDLGEMMHGSLRLRGKVRKNLSGGLLIIFTFLESLDDRNDPN